MPVEEAKLYELIIIGAGPAGMTAAVGGVFIEIGLMPNTEFVGDVVELNHDREIVVDCGCRTSVPGIFAAGDVTTVPEKQIIVAAGEGAKAILGAYRYLLKKTEDR
ncbi:MAG: FAD-dependent oxidoreductase [bacterium]